MAKRWLPSVTTLSSLSMALMMMAPAQAVELGNASLLSVSGQPLQATVQLSDTEGLSAADINVQVASAEDFGRFSLERIAALDTLQIEVDFSGTTPVLRLSSAVTINEPFISLVLDARWPSGRVLTEYTLRLESPAFSSSGAAAVSIAPVRSLQEEPPQPAQQPVAEPAADLPTVAAADAVVSNAGVSSQSSSSPSPAPTPAPATLPPSAASPTTVAVDASAPAAVSVSNASTITVNAGDTLWELAQRVRPDTSVSVQQTMLALQRLNPQAFIGGNINRVRRGEILQVPELSQIRELSATDANSEVNRQNQQLSSSVAATPSQPQTSAPPSAQGAGAQGELRVVTVADDSDGQPVDASAAGNQSSAQRGEQIESLEDRIALGEEDLARLDAQNNELNARLGLLEQQIRSAQEIIRLRDLELAQLQQQLAAEPEAVSADVPPTVITMAPDAGPLQRAMRVLTSNTWAMLGAAGVLVLLLVLLMVIRNRAAAESKAQASARENDSMRLGTEDEELLFSGVAEAAAESAAQASAETQQQAAAADATPAQEAAALYALVEESAEVEAEQEPEKVRYNNRVQQEFEESLKAAAAQQELEAEADLSEPALDDWQPSELTGSDAEPLEQAPLDSRFDLDDTAASNLDDDVMTANQQPPSADDAEIAAMFEQMSSEDTGADLDWPDDDKAARAGDEFDISLTDDDLPPADSEPGELDELDKLDDLDTLDDLHKVSEPAPQTATTAVADDYDDLAFLPAEDDFTDLMEAEDEEDFDFLLDSDEAGTKLDLARAYIDMGDSHGAREILEEVLDEGTEVQRKEAQDLLGRL